MIKGNVVENEFTRVAGDELVALSRHRVIESHDGIRNQGSGWIADHASYGAIMNLSLRGNEKSGHKNMRQNKSTRGCSHSHDVYRSDSGSGAN